MKEKLRRVLHGLWNGWVTGLLAGLGGMIAINYLTAVEMSWQVILFFALFLAIFGAGGGVASMISWKERTNEIVDAAIEKPIKVL